MRFHKIIFVFFIFSISIYSPFAEAKVSSALELSKPLTMDDARQFIDEYTTRFMKLDLDPFKGLFSKRGVENRMLPYADIREAYRKTIACSLSIVSNFEIYTIQTNTRSAFVTGRYEIIQTLKRGGRKVLRGNIQWDLAQEKGSLKIREVNYGRDC